MSRQQLVSCLLALAFGSRVAGALLQRRELLAAAAPRSLETPPSCSEADKLHVLYAADGAANSDYVGGILASAASAVSNSRDPRRLVLHFVLTSTDAMDSVREYLHFNHSDHAILLRGAELVLHDLQNPALRKKIASLIPDHITSYGGTVDNGPEVQRWKSIANYVRFLPNLFAGDNAKHLLWLDADTLVMGDLLDLVAPMKTHKDKAVFQAGRYVDAKHPKSVSIEDGIANKSAISANSIDVALLSKTLYNAGVVGFNLQPWKRMGLFAKFAHWTELNRQQHLFNGGNQMPFAMAVLNHSASEPDALSELSYTWNCQGYSGRLHLMAESESYFRGCYVLHWAHSPKPWDDDEQPAAHSVPSIPFQKDWQHFRHEASNILASQSGA